MITPRPIIVVDTREQAPYSFPSDAVMVVRMALPAGDYSLAGLEDWVSVERKSLDDFVGTVIRDWERFRAELNILRTYAHAAILIEGSIEDVRGRKYKGSAHPESVLGKALSIQIDWGIPVVWAGARPHARDWALGYLDYCWRKNQRVNPFHSPQTPGANENAEGVK